MNNPRRAVVLALIVLCLASRASAIVWTGTITQTVTSSTSPYYTMGMQVQGWYSYECDDVDGVFSGLGYVGALTSTTTLTGALFGFYGGRDADAMNTFDTTHWYYNQHMIVQGGRVIDFHLDAEIGADYFFFFDRFVVTETSAQYDHKVRGTLSFSDPVAASPVGDESTGTTGLLAITGALVILRRRCRRKN